MPGGPKQQNAGWYRKRWYANGVPKAGKKKNNQKAAAVKPQQKEKNKKKGEKKKKTNPVALARMFDPNNNSIPPHLLTVGRCFPVRGIWRSSQSTSATTNTMVMVSSIPGTGTFGAKVVWTVGGAGAATIEMFRSPMIQTSAVGGGAASIKASKCALEVENITQLLNVAGQVYVANLDQRMWWLEAPITMAGTGWDAVATTIKSFPDTKVLPGKVFLRPQRFLCHVVDDVDYTMFDNNEGDVDMNNFGKHLAVWAFPTASNELPRAMSTVVILLGATTPVQDYIFTGQSQHLTRWPLTTVAGQAMKDVPAAAPSLVNAARDVAKARGGITR